MNLARYIFWWHMFFNNNFHIVSHIQKQWTNVLQEIVIAIDTSPYYFE